MINRNTNARLYAEIRMEAVSYRQIGVIHSPFKTAKGMPVQPVAAEGIEGTVEIEPVYAAGLRDIEGFSYIILIYHFHLSEGSSLVVKPFLDDEVHGVFRRVRMR